MMTKYPNNGNRYVRVCVCVCGNTNHSCVSLCKASPAMRSLFATLDDDMHLGSVDIYRSEESSERSVDLL